MEYQTALEVLDFDAHAKINMDELKRRYRKLALQYHPDKNGGSDDSKTRFQAINEAYAMLEARLTVPESDPVKNSKYTSHEDYGTLFHLFMESFASSRDFPSVSVVKEIVLSGCKKLSLKLFENMDKDGAVNTLSFLCKYKDILHIDDNTIDAVKRIIAKKYENDQVFILNPTLDDMLQNNLYRLTVRGRMYFVPLWHSEAYFDGDDGEIIVKCLPSLPVNVYIDEANAIHIDITRKFSVDYFDDRRLAFHIGSSRFEIPKLHFQKTKTYHLENQGLSHINAHDVCEVDKKSGIYVTLTFID